MRFGIFFSYWEDDWKGDYFKYVKIKIIVLISPVEEKS